MRGDGEIIEHIMNIQPKQITDYSQVRIPVQNNSKIETYIALDMHKTIMIFNNWFNNTDSLKTPNGLLCIYCRKDLST